ncbi:uncharacterized protein LOC131167111 isoform X2 [Malania oleifera]|uniref:uncharacterized protein LOC131167111 isoform X2 n=1 Tax=Malania oleifera TaxID=397392 RepID=UPI0025AEB914|nr:uncharacterized protein LOC131167111 isoform X2 [Malania oleifera]
MAAEEDKSSDLYAVLGLKKECTATELRNAYKKLALRWHPDRCSAPGNSKFVEEAKEKFQSIQEAYSVLSDANKRFLYDVGIYDSDDDENGMGDFLNEMAAMMCDTKPSGNGEESFEDLQELFEELFQRDIGGFGSASNTVSSSSSCSSSSSFVSCSANSSANKRNSSEMNSGRTKVEHGEDSNKGKGARGNSRACGGSRQRNGRKQKVSSGHNVSSYD